MRDTPFSHQPESALGGKVRVQAFDYSSDDLRRGGRWLLHKTVLRLSSASLMEGFLLDAPPASATE